MRTRSPVDVESLLRRTYTEVAARTTLGDLVGADEARLVPSTPQRRSRIPALAAATVVVLLVGGLFVVANRRDTGTAGAGTPRHAVAGYLPRIVDDEMNESVFPLTGLVMTSESDRVVYAVDDATVTIETRLDGGVIPDGTPVEVRGLSGVRTTSALHLWSPGGSLVTISWSGSVDPSVIDLVARGLVLLDDEQWAVVTDHGGFGADPDYEPIARFSPESDRDFVVETKGGLHTGLTLGIGPYSMPVPVDRCRAIVDDEVTRRVDPAPTDNPRSVAYLIVVPGSRDAVDVVTDDGRWTVDLTPLDPALDASIGGIVLDDRALAGPSPDVDCGEASS